MNAFGARTNQIKETALLADQMTANMLYRAGSKVSATADGCRLQINFESAQAVFDIPLKSTTLAEDQVEGMIVIKNDNMTRKIKDRTPERFDRLAVRMNRSNVKSIINSFENAIAACSSDRKIASNEAR